MNKLTKVDRIRFIMHEHETWKECVFLLLHKPQNLYMADTEHTLFNIL